MKMFNEKCVCTFFITYSSFFVLNNICMNAFDCAIIMRFQQRHFFKK